MIRPGTIMAATFVLAAAATLAPRAGHAETYAYVGNADSNDISVFKFDASTGEMTPAQTASFVGVDKPGSSTPLAVSPDKTVLIAGIRSQPFQAESFAINAKTGQLSHIGNGPLADSMANIAFDRTGKVLFSASYLDVYKTQISDSANGNSSEFLKTTSARWPRYIVMPMAPNTA